MAVKKNGEKLKKLLESQGVDLEAAARERNAMKERIKKLAPRIAAAQQEPTSMGSFEIEY